MSESIPALDKVPQAAGNAQRPAGCRSESQGERTFARLLATGGDGAAAPPAATTGQREGSSLPDRGTKLAAGKPGHDRHDAASGQPQAQAAVAAPAAAAAGVPTNTQSGAKDSAPASVRRDVSAAAVTKRARAGAQPAAIPVQKDAPASAASHRTPAGTRSAAPDAPPAAPQPVASAGPAAAHGGKGQSAGAATDTPQVATAQAQAAPLQPAAGTAKSQQAADSRQPDPDEATADTAQDGRLAQAAHGSVTKLLQGQGGQGHSGAAGRLLALHTPAVDAAAAQKPGTDALFAHALATTTGSVPVAQVPVAVGHAGWGQAVGEQLLWFVSQHVRMASLRLNPQHLGPLELQLHMDGDKASIAFTSQHVMVRDALESSLPRLRDMFTAHGLELVNVNVSQQGNSGAGSGRPDGYPAARVAPAGTAAVAEPVFPVAVSPLSPQGRGLVDYYV